ncbi:MAG: hypothetical protein WC593_15770 [Methanoregula sp.]
MRRVERESLTGEFHAIRERCGSLRSDIRQYVGRYQRYQQQVYHC